MREECGGACQWRAHPHAAATPGLPFMLELGKALAAGSEADRGNVFVVPPFPAVEPYGMLRGGRPARRTALRWVVWLGQDRDKSHAVSDRACHIPCVGAA